MHIGGNGRCYRYIRCPIFRIGHGDRGTTCRCRGLADFYIVELGVGTADRIKGKFAVIDINEMGERKEFVGRSRDKIIDSNPAFHIYAMGAVNVTWIPDACSHCVGAIREIILPRAWCRTPRLQGDKVLRRWSTPATFRSLVYPRISSGIADGFCRLFCITQPRVPL